MKEELIKGTYTIEELIVPQKFYKLVLVDNKVVIEEVIVSGRKIPLYDIRKSLLQEQKIYMRLCSNEEFQKLTREEIILNLKSINEFEISEEKLDTEILLNKLINYERCRNLMMWHDCSTISNHSHFLMTVSTMYDPAVYLTSAEYFQKTGKKIDMQATIEKPNLYILGRCPSNEQQLLYSQERVDEIIQLKDPLDIDNMQIKDTARIFKGDNPAAQLEAGQQKEGHYFCFVCKMKSIYNKSLFYALQLPYMSLQDRVDKILCSTTTKLQMKINNTNYFANLKKEDVKCELIDRKVKFNLDLPSKDLNELLVNEMHGIQRLPALMYTKPHQSLKDLNLDKYEILSNEPLHDVSNHIKISTRKLPIIFKNQ